MKKIVLALTAMMLLFAGCSNDDGSSGNDPDNPQKPTPTESKIEIAESDKTINFTSDGGERSISFTASESWTASMINNRADEWCSVTPASGNAGFSSIKIAVTANNTPDERSASVQIKSGTAIVTIVVSQKQQDALTVTQSRFDVGAAGGSITVVVAANVDVECSVASAASSWIHPSQDTDTRAMTNSQFKFNIDPNTSSSKREGEITVYGNGLSETIKVYQEKGSGTGDDPNDPNNPNNPGGGDDPDDPNNPGGGDNPEQPETPSIVVSTNHVTLTSAAQSFAVEVNHNVDVAYEISVSWLTHADTRAMSTNTFIFNAEENEDITSRSATIKLTNYANGLSEIVTVTQLGHSATLVVSEQKVELSAAAQSFEVKVMHNVDVDYAIAAEGQSWISRIETRAMKNDAYLFSVAENGVKMARSTTITFTNKDNGLSETVSVWQAEGGPSAKSMFPDPEFREYVLECFDTNRDGLISEAEASNVTEIILEGQSIESLNGIEYFVNMKVLECPVVNTLKTLDVSRNTALTYLRCGRNPLTSLDLSKNTELQNLDCGVANLTNLDLSKNTKLTELICYNNQLISLNVSGFTELTELYCDENQLTSLDVSGCTALKTLKCHSNQLTTLNVSDCRELQSLNCEENLLTSLDLSKNTKLTYLGCYSNPLELLNFGDINPQRYGYRKYSSLEYPYFYGTLDSSTKLKVISSKITELAVGGNNLQSLDISECPALTELSCSNNQLTLLDVSNNPALTSLYCALNQLTSLDLSNNTKLTWLSCYSNQLMSLDVSNTNIGNSTHAYPLNCSGMSTLETLYLKKGWSIRNITEDNGRSTEYIPEQTQIIFVD